MNLASMEWVKNQCFSDFLDIPILVHVLSDNNRVSTAVFFVARYSARQQLHLLSGKIYQGIQLGSTRKPFTEEF